MKKLLCLLVIFGLFAFAYGDETQTADEPQKEIMKSEQTENAPVAADPLVEMYISHGDTAYGKVVIEVLEKEVPIHAKNFLSLVDEGYYNGLTFHRVVPNFVIQGGDPTGTGTGGPPGRLQDDPGSPYKHDRGTIAMARSGEGASKSQFYINLKENYRLDDMGFLIFAKVVEGMDIFDKIATVETSGSSQSPKPVVPVVMTKVVRAGAEAPATEGKTE